MIAILAVLLVALTSLAGPAQALTARTAVLKASPVFEYAGKSVTFSGSVTKTPKNSVVKIQRQSGTSWIAAGQTKTLNASGAYSVVLTLPSTPARYTYRTLVPKTSKLAGVYSKTIVVGALRKTTATLNASPTSLTSGQSSTLTGAVTPFVAGTRVSVQRRTGSSGASSWVQVGTPALNASGAYSFNVSPSTTTVYRVQTPLTGVNAGTVSAERTITVNDPDAPVITTSLLPNGSQFLPYEVTLTKTGGTGTWSVPAGSLPGGLTLNATTGVLSGTPTGSGTRTLRITFTETASGLSAAKDLPITITAAPVITTTTLPDATRGSSYFSALTLSPSANGTWTAPGLPDGLTINAQTGAISGTTFAAPGVYGVYPKFVEAVTGRTSQKALSLTVVGTPLAITTAANLPDAHREGAYSVTFTKVGGPGTWAAVQIPPGFSLDAQTGTLSGTPTVATIYEVIVSFSETSGGTVTKSFALKVLQPKITTTSIPDGVTGTPYSVQFAKTGLDGIWEANGFLPDGLTLSTSGLLTGTPSTAGDFGFQVIFTETATGASSKLAYILHVSAPGSPTITTTSLPNGTVGSPYSATLAATPAGGTWSITTGSLPVGLTLNATTGAITGTPSVPENAQFIVTYTNGSTMNTKVLSILVPAPVA